MLDENDAAYNLIESVGDTLYLHTDLGAPRGRVVAIDLARPKREHWREIVAEDTAVIAFADLVGGRLALAYERDVKHEVSFFDLEGARLGELPMPVIGSIAGWSGRPGERELRFGLTSFLSPTTIYRYDIERGALETLTEPEIDFPADGAVPIHVRLLAAAQPQGRPALPAHPAHNSGVWITKDAKRGERREREGRE